MREAELDGIEWRSAGLVAAGRSGEMTGERRIAEAKSGADARRAAWGGGEQEGVGVQRGVGSKAEGRSTEGVARGTAEWGMVWWGRTAGGGFPKQVSVSHAVTSL